MVVCLLFLSLLANKGKKNKCLIVLLSGGGGGGGDGGGDRGCHWLTPNNRLCLDEPWRSISSKITVTVSV